MATLYFLSGLGSDERIFKNLNLENCELKYLKWINPHPKESLSSYSKRLFEQIETNDEIVLVGLSFGGIVVQELAKLAQPKSVILLSSISNENEKPLYLKLLYYTKIYRFLPYSLAKFLTPLFYRNMGAMTIEEKRLVKDFVQKTDISLLKWSVEQIVNWRERDSFTNLYQIHGNQDKVFPIRLMKPDYIINEGTHFMVYNKSDEISEIINTIV